MKLLAYTSPARGHLYPLVPIATTLAARGHEVCLCTLSEGLGPLADLGIAASAIDPAVERLQLEDWRERLPHRAFSSVFRTFAARAPGEVSDLTREIARQHPDVLLIDILCWGAAAVAEASGLPWAMYSPYLLSVASRDAPPFGLGLPPRDDALGRARDAVVRRIATFGADQLALAPINALRARQGLKPLDHYEQLLERPHLLLGLTAEGFDYPRSDWPANVRLVGPSNWAPPQATPPWLAGLADPLVLVTCSTERQRDEQLVDAALRGLPPVGINVIATTAAHDPSRFSVPPGSRAERFVPHEQVIERAACVVCHGGLGITQKALAAGVPVVVVPFGRDQLETARRVVVAEAGVSLSPRRLTPAHLAAAVEAALGCRAGAERVSRAYAEAGGPPAAAAAIEALFEQSRGRLVPR